VKQIVFAFLIWIVAMALVVIGGIAASQLISASTGAS
jgi:hypothetical protein